MTEEDRHYIRYNDHSEGDINGGGPMRRGNRHHNRSGDSYGAGGATPYRSRKDDPRNEEKQCRTLFVRNIQFDTKEEEIWKVFSPYGDIKEIFNRMETRGIVFVHYYDLRSAERAKRDCENIKIGGRHLDIHYSVPKDDIRVVKCDRTKNQGTLLLSLNGSQLALVDSELYEYFKQFGDVKVIRTPTFKTSSENTERWQRFVEFYDSRAAVRAADATHGQSYKNGIWDVTYFWDQGPRERRDTSPRRGDRMRRSDPRSNRHDRYDDHRRTRHTSPPPRMSHSHSHSHSHSSAPSSSSSQWNPPPSSMPPLPTNNNMVDQGQLEKTQKAQQLLTLLSQLQSGQNQAQPQAPPPIYAQQQQPVPNNIAMSGPPLSAAPPPQQQQQQQQNPNQIQQLLGMLSQISGNTSQPPQPPQLQQQPPPQPQSQAYTNYQVPYQQYQQPQQQSQQPPLQYQQQPQQPQQQQQPLQYHHQQPQPQHHHQQQQQQQQHTTYSPYAVSTHDPNSHPPYNP